MKYKIVILKRARKYIEAQTAKVQKQLLYAIQQLPNGDTKQLKGKENLFRLRVGNVRVIYSIDNNIITITVIDIGNRGQIYNRYWL